MKILLISLIFLICYVFILFTLVQIYAKKSIEYGSQAKNSSDMFSTILVLGAGVNGLKPSNELQSRLNLASQVWDQNNHLLVFISGGIISENNEPQAMFNYLHLKGIPESNLRILKSSFNTRETFNSFKQITSNLPPGKLLAISSPYHCFRIKMESRRQKIILSTASDKDSPEYNHKYTQRIRLITEVFAITFYLLPHSFTKKTPIAFQGLRRRIPKILIRLGS
jgi:uncharacterized SAM-binding protein YcdF (DUF218 family)